MVKVGDRIMLPVQIDKGSEEKLPGTVVWIHPKKRFFRAAFKTKSGVIIHSCFLLRRA